VSRLASGPLPSRGGPGASVVAEVQRSRIVFAALALGYAGVAPAAAAGVAAISIDPASGPPGQLVTVRGTGFCASGGCGRVRIQVSTVVVADGIRVSPGGSFRRTRVPIPGGVTPGDVAVIASQRLATGRRRETLATFEVLVLGSPRHTRTTTTETTSESGPTRPPGTTSGTSTEGRRTTPKQTAPTPTETKRAETNAAARAGDDGGLRGLWWALAAGALALAAVGAALLLRARRGR
jgi:hypothetical protein